MSSGERPEAGREALLGRVRAALAQAGSEQAERSTAFDRAAPPPGLPAPLESPAERARVFTARLERVDGRVVTSAAAELTDRVHDELAALGARRVAFSSAELPRRVAGGLGEGFEAIRGGADRDALLGADVGLTEAQHAVAETGTLVLASDREDHRLVSLVPTAHVALLPASRILSTLDEALSAVRRGVGVPTAVTFVTGPSRTADIELSLVVGVHGPRQLTVILIEDL